MPSLDSSTKTRTREASRPPSTHSNVNEEVPEEIKATPFQPDFMEENVTPLHDIQYKGSFILRKVRMLLQEVVDRAERPAFKLHISIPPHTLENETCTICWDAIEPDRANFYGWEDSHSEVVTSCGHIFGGKCLWTVSNIPLSSLYRAPPFTSQLRVSAPGSLPALALPQPMLLIRCSGSLTTALALALLVAKTSGKSLLLRI